MLKISTAAFAGCLVVGFVFVVDAQGIVRYAHRAVAGLTFRSTDELVAAVHAAQASSA